MRLHLESRDEPHGTHYDGPWDLPGKPVIRGMRYPVELILDLLRAGMTTEEILTDYEDLQREDILAVFSFAARLSQIKRIDPVLA